MNSIAIYMRVSTTDQNISMQEREIIAYLQVRGITDYKLYKDEGFSGKNSSRPALKSLLVDVQTGQIKLVVIWKLDRLGRSLGDLLGFIKTFDEYGTSLVSVRDNIDLSTSQGKFFMQMLGAFAEFERNMIIERTRSGIANARSKGIPCGRPSKFGKATKQIMLDRAMAGVSKSAIARELGLNVGSVHYFLKKEQNELRKI